MIEIKLIAFLFCILISVVMTTETACAKLVLEDHWIEQSLLSTRLCGCTLAGGREASSTTPCREAAKSGAQGKPAKQSAQKLERNLVTFR